MLTHAGASYDLRDPEVMRRQIELARTHPQAVVAGLHPGTVDTGLSAPFQKGVKPEKLFTADHSAGRLLGVLDGLTPAQSGGFYDARGKQILW